MTPAQQRLLDCARRHQGFFTAKDAVAAGIAYPNHKNYVRSGQWVRSMHGIYRLKDVSENEHSELYMLSLWLRGQQDSPQGFFSRQTALWLNGLSELPGPCYEISVATGFKRTRLPQNVSLISVKHLADGRWELISHLPVEKPLFSIGSLIEGGLISNEKAKSIYSHGRKLGVISLRDLKEIGDKNCEFLQLLNKWEREYEKV